MQIKNKIPVMTLILVAVNVLVYLYVEWNGSSNDVDYMLSMGASYEPYILENHEWYRLITHFFLHFGWDHLFNNMISLLVLGYALEQVMGKLRYTVLYFLSGIVAGVASIAYNIMVTGEYSVSCGASGAIYGLTGALLVLLIRGNRNHRSTEVPRYLLYLAVSLYSGFQDTSIDNAAHVGGFLAGVVICFFMSKTKQMEVTYES